MSQKEINELENLMNTTQSTIIQRDTTKKN
jgi:hypothetical protein